MALRCSIAFFVLALFLQVPLSDVDLFTQLRLGAEQLAQGALYQRETLVAPRLHATVANPGWLFQIVAAWLSQRGGLETLFFLHAVLLFLAFELLLKDTQVLPLARLCAYVLAFVVAQSNLVPRPQIVALVAFAGGHALLRSQLSGAQKVLLLFPLLLVWQNCHPSISLFLPACLGMLARNRSRWGLPVLCACLVILVSILTPDGLGLRATSAYNVEVSRFLGVSEWLPPWTPGLWSASAVFWTALPLSIYLFVKSRAALTRFDFIEPLIFLALSLWATRFIVFFAMAMLPLWGRAFNQVLGGKPFPSKLFAPVLCVLGLMLLSRIQLLDSQIPLAEIQRLKAERPEGVIYNYREWAGPLVYFGSVGWQLRIDGRLYLSPFEDWENYYAEARGEVPLEVLEATYNPRAFFLHPGFNSGLVELLRNGQKWREISSSSEAIVFVSTP